jgi:hypothetical protein
MINSNNIKYKNFLKDHNGKELFKFKNTNNIKQYKKLNNVV